MPRPQGEGAPTPAARRAGGGIDLGWLAAFVGCVVAALALARPVRARRADGRGRVGLVEGLRLLAGRG